MNKVVRNGEVAVLISRSFGAGWYTWNRDIPECLTHPEIVALVEAEATDKEIEKKATELWPKGYWGGADGLEIVWVSEGTEVILDEYDGSESFADFTRRGFRV